MRFQKGDEVVVCSLDVDAGSEVLKHSGHVGRVRYIDDQPGITYRIYLFGLDGTPFGEHELEFAHIYNSPLYKALT